MLYPLELRALVDVASVTQEHRATSPRVPSLEQKQWRLAFLEAGTTLHLHLHKSLEASKLEGDTDVD